MKNQFLTICIVVLFSVLCVSCSQTPETSIELKRFQLNHMDNILSRSGLTLDKQISFDGQGSIRIDTDSATVVRLFELSDINIENASLIYRARLRSQNLEGRAYLEMYCCFDQSGEYFARDLQTPIMGTTNWVTEETRFYLERGQNPDRVKLNLVIEGSGTVWIDDIRLIKGI